MTCALAIGFQARGVAGVVALAVAAGLGAQVARWPVAVGLRDRLLAMLVLSYLWLPAGFPRPGLFIPGGQGPLALGFHALGMGAMGGLIMGVSARAFARRDGGALRAARGVFPGFVLIMLAVALRLARALDLAALTWGAGWLLCLGLMLPRLRGPVPRPVFSGARVR